jgi:hypothetical protein
MFAYYSAAMSNRSILKDYAYLWITLILFLGSLFAHWTSAWFAFVEEQNSHNQPIEFASYFVETFRDTMENWQSEFLQLIWQVAGLAAFWYLGSPQSKEGDERKEEKLDELLRLIGKKEGEKIIARLDNRYPRDIKHLMRGRK